MPRIIQLLKKHWILSAAAATLFLSLLFSENLRATLFTQRAIAQVEDELLLLSASIEEARIELRNLEKNEALYEQLVRSELGYLRPGEKEVRFVRGPL